MTDKTLSAAVANTLLSQNLHLKGQKYLGKKYKKQNK